MAYPFPEDIMYEILSRLPIKSLARFQCVSKAWLKYINDPSLHTIHVKEEPTPIMFHGVGHNKIRISFLRSVQEDPVLELDYKATVCGSLLLGSCNGLTLVSYEPSYDGFYRVAVINPLTKERNSLPPISINRSYSLIDLDGLCDATGIGFDDSTNTFKTVHVIVKNPDLNVVCTMVHSSGMSSWREITQIPAYPIRGDGVFAHGRLHWLVDWQFSDIINDGRKIVCFDVKTEEFGLTDIPRSKLGHSILENQLVDLNGEVGFAYIGPACIKLWRLKCEEWVLHCCFDLSVILPHYDDIYVEVSGCWNKDGDILLAYNGGERGKCMFVYTLKTGELREVKRGLPYEADVRMYQISLCSLFAYSIKNC